MERAANDVDHGGGEEDMDEMCTGTPHDSLPEKVTTETETPPDDSGVWQTVATRKEKAVKAAMKKVAREVTTGAPVSTKSNNRLTVGDKGNEWRPEIIFESPNDPEGLKKLSLLKIYTEIRATLPGAHARFTTQGKLAIRIAQPEDEKTARTLTSVCGITVAPLTDTSAFWGRISGVNTQFQEDDLLECLKEQGVGEVKREKYAAADASDQNNVVKIWKNSGRVRLRFNGPPLPEVFIAGERFQVTLCAGSPLQCLSCHKFGHKAAVCTKKASPTCRRCAKPGHQMWQCQEKAHCANCGGAHSANDNRCSVRQVYSEAQRQKLYEKVSTRLQVSTSIEDFPAMNTESSPSTNSSDGRKSYAEVMRSPSKPIMSKDGKTVVCHLPAPKKPNTADNRAKQVRGVEPKRQSFKDSTQQQAPRLINGFLKILGLFRPLISEWLKKNPIIDNLLNFLESEPGKAFLTSVFEGSDVNAFPPLQETGSTASPPS